MTSKKDPQLLKSHTKRCPGPFPEIKNHSKSKEQRIASLSKKQADKCAAAWPEKGLTVHTELCWKCRLHIENFKLKGAVVPLQQEEDVGASLTCASPQCTVQNEAVSCGVVNSPWMESPDLSRNDSLLEISSAIGELNVSCNDAVIELEDLNIFLDSLRIPRLRAWQFNESTKHLVKNSLISSIAAITSWFERVSAAFGITVELPRSPCDDCQDLLSSMKKRYPGIHQKEYLYLMLTCAPKSLSIRRLQEAVGCSIYEARLSIECRKAEDHNAFVTPNWKSTGHPMSTEWKQKIVYFYLDDLYTRPSPNARDARYGTHPLTGIRELCAKRLIPVNSSEFYGLFCEIHPDVKVHYSTFVKLRPVWCKWPGRFGHHNTCTCMAHENFHSKLRALQCNSKLSDFIHRLMCTQPGRNCYFGLCQNCPRLEELHDLPIETDTVTFELWKQENKRMSYITVTQPTDELIQELQDEFIGFTTHHYTTKLQAQFIESLNNRCIEENAVIMKVDFAENYAFNAQNSPTAFHWNNDQATIHPFCISYPLNGTLKKITYVVVSNSLEHSALSFHLFRRKVIDELKEYPWWPSVTKIYYISDGAGSQYKNRFNFCTLFHHRRDFGLPAEWTFTATAHGKSECDATSGTIKSSAHRAAWAGTTILTPLQLFNFFRLHMTTLERKFIFADSQELELLRADTKSQFESTVTVRGTRKFHSVQVTQRGLRFKVLSLDLEHVDVDLAHESKKYEENNEKFPAGTFVVVKSTVNGGIVGRLLKWEPDDTAKIAVMKASGTKNNFTWPVHDHVVFIAPHEILMKLNDPVQAGRSARYLKLHESDYKKYSALKK